MSAWRVIITDSESMSGVAPVCMSDGHPDIDETDGAEPFVYDCCPRPHIECWSEHNATSVAAALNAADAEVCS